MIRNLTIIAAASFVLALGCFAGAAAIGGRDLMKHGWTFPTNWHVQVDDHDDHVSLSPGDPGAQAGPDVTRQIAWTGAKALELDVPAAFVLTQGPKAGVVVTGPKALADRVKVEAGRIWMQGHGGDDQDLVSITGRGVHIARGPSRLRIEITAPAVSAVTLNGGGELEIRDYDQPDLALAINGGGDISARGKTQRLNVNISGSGQANLREIQAGDARIKVAGSGETTVAARGAVDVDIAGSGEVSLTERPARLTKSVAGSGDVREEW